MVISDTTKPDPSRTRAASTMRPPLDTIQRDPARRAVLRSLERGLYWSGLAAAFAKMSAPGAVILAYHCVTTTANVEWIDPANAMPLAIFAAQMAFLARHRRVISMSELIDAIDRRKPFPRGTVVLTFDDGYRDVLELTAPILSRHKLPAVVYLPTGCISRGETPWIDRLYTAFVTRTRHALSIEHLGLSNTTLNGAASTLAAYRRIAGRLIETDLCGREQALAAIAEQLQPARTPPRLSMTWDEVRQLRQHHPQIEIGAHTVDHIDISTCPDGHAQQQIQLSSDEIQREMGFRPAHFACPYDRRTQRAADLAAAAGFRSVVATGGDPWVRPGSDRMALTRINSTRSSTLLRYITSGAYPRLPKMLFGRS